MEAKPGKGSKILWRHELDSTAHTSVSVKEQIKQPL